MIKYESEYANFEGSLFKIEISQDSYTGVSTYISAVARLEYASVSDVLQCLRGSGLQIDLEASQALDFTDLYAEKETEFKVSFYIDGVVKFIGFIKPDGIFTDFVNEIYTISLDAVDGLGILKNLSFVDDSGLHFSGYMTEQEIVYNCLRRTSLNLPINVDIGVFQYGTTQNENTLTQTKLSTDRFIKDDESTIMDCEEVLRSVLEKYCAIIHQHNGEWYIYRPLDLVRDNSLNFFRYVDNVMDSERVLFTSEKMIGSAINGFKNHHQNKDQKITIKGSTSAYRVNYKYGVSKNFFTNPKFIPNPDGTIDGWNIQSNPKFMTNPNGGLFYSEMLPSYQLELISDVAVVGINDLLELSVRLNTTGNYFGINLKIILTDGTQTKYLKYSDFTPVEWSELSTSEVNISNYSHEWTECASYEPENVPVGRGDADFLLDIPPVPFNGNIKIQIYTPEHYTTNLPCFVPFDVVKAEIKEVKILPKEKGNELIKGEIHTVIRTPKTSSIVKDNKTIYIGDMSSDIFEGTIKNADGENTRFWNRRGMVERKSILEIMVEDTLRVSYKPSKVFSGTVAGYLPFLSFLRIDNIQGRFMITSFVYDCVTDATNITCTEIHSDTLTNFEYQKTFDYGNTVKPTILG